MTDEPASTKPVYGTKTVFCGFDDSAPDSVAEGIDTLVERAIDELAENGHVPVGPVSIAMAGWTESNYRGGPGDENRTRHSGILATITYKSE